MNPHAHILKEWLYQHRWSEPVTYHFVMHIIRLSGDNKACNVDALSAIDAMVRTGDLWPCGEPGMGTQFYKINPARLSRSGRGMSRCQHCGRNLWIEETVDQHTKRMCEPIPEPLSDAPATDENDEIIPLPYGNIQKGT